MDQVPTSNSNYSDDENLPSFDSENDFNLPQSDEEVNLEVFSIFEDGSIGPTHLISFLDVESAVHSEDYLPTAQSPVQCSRSELHYREETVMHSNETEASTLDQESLHDNLTKFTEGDTMEPDDDVEMFRNIEKPTGGKIMVAHAEVEEIDATNQKADEPHTVTAYQALTTYFNDPNCWRQFRKATKSRVIEYMQTAKLFDNIDNIEMASLVETKKFEKLLAAVLMKKFAGEKFTEQSVAKCGQEQDNTDNCEDDRKTLHNDLGNSDVENIPAPVNQLSVKGMDVQQLNSDSQQSNQVSMELNEVGIRNQSDSNLPENQNLNSIASTAIGIANCVNEPNQDSIYDNLESVSERAFTKMTLIQNNDEKQSRKVCQILFDALFDENEILEGSLSGRKRRINGQLITCYSNKILNEAKTLAIVRFYAWMRSKPEVQSMEHFKEFEEELKKQNEHGLPGVIYGHIQERIFVKHACSRRKRLEKT